MIVESNNSSLSLMGEGQGEGVSARIQNARRLRTNMTVAERKLWKLLRTETFSRWKIRRQHPVGSYIVDFACPEILLAIELDGGQHSENAKDLVRTSWLERNGWRVVRFWNNEISQNLDGVLQTLLRHFQAAPLHRKYTLTRPASQVDLSHEGEVKVGL